jgi:DNA polymerase
MLHFLDFESFKRLWTCVIINPITRTKTEIVNDPDKLEDYYNQFKNEIFIGYNIRGYDQYVFKGILCGFDPYEITQWIIVDKKSGYEFSNLFRNFPLNIYDVQNKFNSLKQLEGFMGNDIRETTIPFDYDGEFTPEMINEVLYYNTHDVEQTMEVWLQTQSDFNAQMDLIKTFNLPLSYIGKTKAQLTAAALGCQRKKHNDEWEISFVDTIRLNKYKYIWDWFRNPLNYKEGQKLTVEVCGVPHTFGLGGIHGAPDQPLHRTGLLIHVDVTSYYPSLMIEYDLLSRNVKDKSVFKQVYDKRVALKKAGKKKEQAPYKIILNSTFGITNDKYSLAYDPRRNHEVCINGQLLLLDLLEKLEGHCDIIQSNTDGLIIQIPNTQAAFNEIDDICYEWESRTRMKLGFDLITEIYQKDVNNYVFTFTEGGYECKGAYVKPLNEIDYDLPIVNEALVAYMTKHTPIAETINNCNDLIKFQKIVRVSSKYMRGALFTTKRERVWSNQDCAYRTVDIPDSVEYLTDKTFRVFASKNKNDGRIGKQKTEGATIEKFANTPDHCFIDNGNVKNKSVPKQLDKQWYIELAKERLKQFGLS